MSEIQGKFERIGWGPVRNADHDLGTDLLIAARDERGFERGIIGAQAKGGPSWFKEEVRNADGAVQGWWFSEDGVEHFEDWVRHPLPHLVVIHDLDADVSYWAHVTKQRVRRTGKGCKILVPIDQTVDSDNLDALLAVVSAVRRSESLEHTAFSASSEAVSPGRRMRYALLAPRLVAPHRNAGYQRTLEPEEAVALISLGRFRDLKTFSEHHDRVPDPESRATHRDWRWRLVQALWRWADSDEKDLSEVLDLAAESLDPPAKAAATVVLIVLMRRLERISEAITIADSLLIKDNLWPVDLAWILVHRARLRSELGATDDANSDALAALKHIRGEHEDPTASAIGAAAAWILYQHAELGDRGLGEALAAADTVVTWWRGQLIASAAQEAIAREFRDWSEDPGTRFVMEDVEKLNLFAAEFNADLAADHGSWRAASGLRSRNLLATATDDATRLQGIDSLRRSGDAQALKLAARRLAGSGPVMVLRTALERLTPDSWTHTTFKSNLTLLAAGGDLLSEDQATAIALECAALASGNRARMIKALRPTFTVPLDALEALAGLLPAAGAEAHEAAAELVLIPELSTDALLQSPLVRIVRMLDVPLLSYGRREQLRTFAFGGERSAVTAAVLRRFVDEGEEEARSELRSRVREGDVEALEAHGDITTLTIQDARRQVERLVKQVCQTVDEAAQHHYSFGGSDPIRNLALFNLWFAEVAEWDVLLEALESRDVAAEQKRDASWLLMALAARIPDGMRARVASLGEHLRDTSPRDLFGGAELGGLPSTLTAATTTLSEHDVLALLVPLLVGSDVERRDFAEFLGHHDVPRLRVALAGLLSDESADVRLAAATALGQRLSAAPTDPIIWALATRVAADKGTQAPLALLRGLRDVDEAARNSLLTVFAALRSHPASRVARAAKRAFPDSASNS